MTGRQLKLEASWKKALGSEFEKPYMQSLRSFLRARQEEGHTIFPKGSEYFNAFDSTPFDQVKVVIVGQDPYHGPGQAHGLCFSVRSGVVIPPSLKNIFKELSEDLGVPIPSHGCLQAWAKQGVLLLNSVLTVEQGRAGAHQGKGWERFTDRVIEVLNERCNGLVFMLWGSYAQNKCRFVDEKKHLVLKSPHPSPLSAHRGFFGNRHFSKANAFLRRHRVKEIDWRLETPALAGLK